MNEYITLVELNPETKQYRSIVKNQITGDILFTSEYAPNTETVLKSSREFFITGKLPIHGMSFNSEIKPVTENGFPVKPRKCCGR